MVRPVNSTDRNLSLHLTDNKIYILVEAVNKTFCKSVSGGTRRDTMEKEVISVHRIYLLGDKFLLLP